MIKRNSTGALTGEIRKGLFPLASLPFGWVAMDGSILDRVKWPRLATLFDSIYAPVKADLTLYISNVIVDSVAYGRVGAVFSLYRSYRKIYPSLPSLASNSTEAQIVSAFESLRDNVMGIIIPSASGVGTFTSDFGKVDYEASLPAYQRLGLVGDTFAENVTFEPVTSPHYVPPETFNGFAPFLPDNLNTSLSNSFVDGHFDVRGQKFYVNYIIYAA